MKFFVCLFLASFLLIAAPAWASSVLLPDDNSSGSTGTSSGSMGLSPEIPTPTPPAAAKPKTASQAATNGQTAPAQQNIDLSKILSMGNVTIKPGGALPKMPQAAQGGTAFDNAINGTSSSEQLSGIEQRIKAYKEEQEKKYERDPTLMDEIPLDKPNDQNLPGSITISIDPRFLWGLNDIEQIQRYLGYTSQQIPQNCQIRLDAQVETNTDKYQYGDIMYSGEQKTIRYDGNLTMVSFKPRAVCNPPQTPLPRHGGIIMKTGNKYSVILLNEAPCPLPQQASSVPSSLAIQYQGDGKAQCVYR